MKMITDMLIGGGFTLGMILWFVWEGWIGQSLELSSGNSLPAANVEKM